MAHRQELIAFREALNLTQQEVASKLNISRSFYCRIEGGLRNPKPMLLKKFASVFGLTLEHTYDLFFSQNSTKMERVAGIESS